MADHEDDPNASIEAVYELFSLDVDLTRGEIEQGLRTVRDLARESLLDLAEAAGIGTHVAVYLRMVEEATLLLRGEQLQVGS